MHYLEYFLSVLCLFGLPDDVIMLLLSRWFNSRLPLAFFLGRCWTVSLVGIKELESSDGMDKVEFDPLFVSADS